MAYLSELCGSVYLLRWVAPATAADLTAQLHDLATARRDVGRPLIYLSITPAEIDAPSPEGRAALDRFAGAAEAHCSSVHLVLEGHGFRGTILRSLVTGVVLAHRQHRLVSVHAKIEEALARLHGRGINSAEIRRIARTWELEAYGTVQAR